MKTSIDAFDSIQNKLGEKQFFILKCLIRFEEGATNLEISTRFGVPINCTTPRIKELRDFGLVYKCQERPCKISGNRAAVWKVFSPEEAVKNFSIYLENKDKPVEQKKEIQKVFL